MSSHTSDANARRCPPDIFWRLSPELRNLVYDQVYENDVTNGDTLSLMRASKQSYFEAGSHFFARHTVNLTFPLRPTAGATVLSPVSDRFLPYLKDVGLEFEVGPSHFSRVKEASATIRKLTTIGANFREVTCLIQFPSELSVFLQRKLDDSTMKEDHPITAALRDLLDSGMSQIVNVAMNGAWFAPGVATSLKGRYLERLKFVQLKKSTGLSEIDDPALYERPLTGYSSMDVHKGLGIPIDHVDEYPIARMGDDLDLLVPLHDTEDGDSESFISEPVNLFGDANETSGDDDAADLDSDDDADIEDLVPLEEGEADAIVDNLKDTGELLADEARTQSEIRLLVNMAPHLLFAQSTKR